MAEKIKKGDVVWFFAGYDGKATMAVYKYGIKSAGAKQGTAVQETDGKFIESRIYAENYKNMVPVADMPDPAPYAMELAAAYKADNIKRNVDAVTWYACGSGAPDGYFAAMKKDCAEIMEAAPKVVFK